MKLVRPLIELKQEKNFKEQLATYSNDVKSNEHDFFANYAAALKSKK